MSRLLRRSRLEWVELEPRLCPAVTGAAALVVPVQRTDSYAVARHARFLSQVESGNDRIVFFGDSMTENFSDSYGASTWASKVAPLGAAAFGVAGDTAENLLWRIENGELAGYPKLAVVEIGTNDLNLQYSANYTVAAVQAVVEEIQTLSPTTQVFLMGLFPRGLASDPIRQEVAAINSALGAWAVGQGIGFAEMSSQLISDDGTITTHFMPDNGHLNALGYQEWDDAIQGLLVDTSLSSPNAWDPGIAPGYTTSRGPSSIVASHQGVAGIATAGTVWHDHSGGVADASAGQGPWRQLGSLAGVVSLVASANRFGQSELFAQRDDGSVWVYNYTWGLWANTGGYLVPNTMIADGDGIVGLSSGWSVFQYADGSGWARVGTLGSALSLVASKNLSGQSELFAQLADASVWVFHWQTGRWTSTGGHLVPGTMVADSNGISGVAGGGAVFHDLDERGWVQVGSLTGAVSLVASQGPTGDEQVFARLADLSVWVFNYSTATWRSTGGKINPGTLVAAGTGAVGIAGGTVFRNTGGPGWIPISPTTSLVAVVDGRNAAGSDTLFARASDGTLFEFVLGLSTGWAASGVLRPTAVLPLSYAPNPFGTHNPDVQTAKATALFKIVLGRAPDAPGLASAVSVLKNGGSFRDLASSFLHSAEYDTRVVASYFQVFLGRSGSSSEVSAWVALMQQGLTVEQVAYDFLISSEFNARYADDTSFIRALYDDLLGREADAREVSAWLAAMGSGRAHAAGAFLHSAEAGAPAVAGFFPTFYGVQATPADIAAGVSSLQGGTSLTDLALLYLTSDGFLKRAAATVG